MKLTVLWLLMSKMLQPQRTFLADCFLLWMEMLEQNLLPQPKFELLTVQSVVITILTMLLWGRLLRVFYFLGTGTCSSRKEKALVLEHNFTVN